MGKKIDSENKDGMLDMQAFKPPVGPQCPSDSVEGLRERVGLRLPLAAYESYNKLRDAGLSIVHILLLVLAKCLALI